MEKKSTEKGIGYVEKRLSQYHRLRQTYGVLSKTIRTLTITFAFAGFTCPFLEKQFEGNYTFLYFGYLFFLCSFLLQAMDHFLSITPNWTRYSVVYNEIKSSYEEFLSIHNSNDAEFDHSASILLKEVNKIIRSETLFWAKSYEIKPTYVDNIMNKTKPM